ncbi:MAG TPA: hypothetical protein VF476_17215 [Chitinophagaceae bacterium]
MKIKLAILSFFAWTCFSLNSFAQENGRRIVFDFYGDSIDLSYDPASFIDYKEPLSERSLQAFYKKISNGSFDTLVNELKAYKIKYKLDDWLYYQLIRKTAQQISPKADNYHRYTLYKWFFLAGSGYDAILSIASDTILFYVRSEENIYNIPYRTSKGKQYVCLNYHDYGSNIDFEKTRFRDVSLPVPGAVYAFSYKVTNLPNFRPGNYLEKDIRFNYRQHDDYFKVKLNPEIKMLFANYPTVDYSSYFNIPLSQETYLSLIPFLKEKVKGMKTKKGVDYLMHFTRNAFIFETDTKAFGAEKRLSPEQTLLYDQSDCEDRAALFFYLVKEIYNLPMIVLAFPEHVTVAIKFSSPTGIPIIYNGERYSVCEPTPQKKELKIGQLIPSLENKPYEVAYAYNPAAK